MHSVLHHLLLVLTVVVGCKSANSFEGKRAEGERVEGEGCGVGLAEPSSQELSLQANEPITYYKDIYPILTSQVTGEVYKCATCHSAYLDPEDTASVSKVNMMVAAMRSGRMPVSGDRVKDVYIQRLLEWRLTGFKIGDKSQIPTAEIDPSVYASNSATSHCP